jgi:hypothetical protein
MTAKLRSRLTYANVVATLALFLVVAGGSVALGGGRSQQSGQALQLQQQLKHNVKKVKGLVKEVEAQQDTSDQQTQAKLDLIDNRIIDLHVQLGSRLDKALARLQSLCLGQGRMTFSHEVHDDRSVDVFTHPVWKACQKAAYFAPIEPG